MIKTSTEKYIFSSWMPFNVGDSAFMALQFNQPLVQMNGQAIIRNVPQLNL